MDFRFQELRLVHYLNDETKYNYFCVINKARTQAYIISKNKVEPLGTLKYLGQLEIPVYKVKMNEYLTAVRKNNAVLTKEDVKRLEKVFNQKHIKITDEDTKKYREELETLFNNQK